jgi:hypothetical protein
MREVLGNGADARAGIEQRHRDSITRIIARLFQCEAGIGEDFSIVVSQLAITCRFFLSRAARLIKK